MPIAFPDPQISTSTAHLLTFLFASSYVGSLYLSKTARLSFSSKVNPTRNGEARRKEQNERWRDDPDVIRARLASVSLATLFCCLVVTFLLWHLVGNVRFYITLESVLTRLGLNPNIEFDIRVILPHLVTPLLFLGPLYSRYLLACLPFQRNWNVQHHLIPLFRSWQGVRNYIVAPITEEVVFRACVLSVYQLSGASRTRMVFFSPLSFAAAHIHHAWDTYNRYGRTVAAAKRAIIMSLFQLGYTSLFGFHCAYLFLRTGSILPPITTHVFCNIMGVPQLGYDLESFPQKKALILTAYVVGVVAFVGTLGPWTKITDSLYWQDVAFDRVMY